VLEPVSYRYLGIDPGVSNLGVAVLLWDGDTLAVESSARFTASSGYDFIRNADVVNFLRRTMAAGELRLGDKQYIAAAAVESPAYAARFQMVSIGTLHGVLLQTLIDAALPFLYVTPNKLKFFAAGPAKSKPWSKEKIISCVRAGFGLAGDLDPNIADAIVLATMAFACHQAAFKSPPQDFVTPWDAGWAHKVFLGTAKASKGKKDGILHRPNEFFYLPPFKP
jgi:Holliday junction resolvasome RuvABC endonuclease subunit